MIEIRLSTTSLLVVRPGRLVGWSKCWRIIVGRLDKNLNGLIAFDFCPFKYKRDVSEMEYTDQHDERAYISSCLPPLRHTVYDVIVKSLNDYIYSFPLYSHTRVGQKEEKKEEVITLPG